ncbi:hypothetical protein [Candidatus Palauibacter sp.]|uniref:hypothetical protein n=1 Tax=Candidatus Palauibacter sp. TaxID=3101350 RepID=UPI003B029D87
MNESRRPRLPGLRLGIAALGALAVLAACTEEPLSLGSEQVPGAGTRTTDVTVSVVDLGTWRDTTLTGFALPSGAPFVVVSNGPSVASHAFARFNVPDTIRTLADTLPVDRFEEVELFVRFDTTQSRFGGFPLTLRLLALEQPFDPDSATWLRASPGLPWTTPGGDLGVEIASGVLEAVSDTIVMSPSVAEDSLMKAWQDEDGGNGFALVVEGPETDLRVTRIILRYDPTLVGRTRPVPQVQQWDERTFVLDPPLPPTSTDLRVGGLPASRIYLEFAPPTSLGGVSLDGATISQAEVILYPLPPPEPYAAERPIEARRVSLLGDPFVRGAKTPIGSGDLQGTRLDPDLLSDGLPVRMNITFFMAQAVRDSVSRIRFAVRGDPDAQALGYWEFGSAESPPEFQPRLRVVFSPAPDFGVP